MKSIIAFLILSSYLVIDDQSPPPSTWSKLVKVSYKKSFDEILGIPVDKPIFSKDVKNLEGKKIILKGYIIPTDGYKSHKEFIFSAFPYSSCFFCGKAGPETVVEVEAIEAIQYTSEPIEIEGILKLNSEDINRLMYQLSHTRKI
ncbi:MAG: hypothetical protein IT267_02250 [Saprospiraceae bacterium]|nr:hypothetical protein [Saprospiraceae bacterium]